MTAFDNIQVNNWPAASNEFEDYLVLEMPLNDAASLTNSRRDIVAGSKVLHPKVALTNSSTTTDTPGNTHALVFRGAGAPKKHLEDNTQTNGSFYSQSNHHVAGDASTDFWDWTFTPPIPNVTNVKVNSRHLNQHFNPYYYQVYDENDNAQVATPVDKASVTSDTEIYAGSAFNLKRIKMYGGAGGDDFFKIIINGVTLNQSNGIGTVTEDASHTASTTYSTGIPKKHYDNNAVFSGTTRINTATASNLAFGTRDFTVECWAYPEGNSAEEGIFQMSTDSVGIATTATNVVSLQMLGGAYRSYANDGSRQWATNVTAGQWVHLALVRQSGTLRLYVNGVADANTYSDPRNYSCRYINVGGYYDSNYLWTGSIQDLRVYNGVAKYTANFTPPGAILG